MSILVNLTPQEEARLAEKAKQTGVNTAEFVEHFLRTHLISEPITSADMVRAKLRQWQEETGTVTGPALSVRELFARWAEEDALKTDEDLAVDERLWQEYQQGIDETRRETGMRTLFGA